MSDTKGNSPWPVELLKALAWPLVVLFLLMAFWKPLQAVGELLPQMFEKLDTVTVGGVRVDVRSALAEKAPNAVKLVLAKLSPAGIQYIVENGESGVTRTTKGVLLVEQQELIAAKLCRDLTKAELTAKHQEDLKTDRKPPIYEAGFDCSDSYDDTRKFLLDLIPELVRQATKARNVMKDETKK